MCLEPESYTDGVNLLANFSPFPFYILFLFYISKAHFTE